MWAIGKQFIKDFSHYHVTLASAGMAFYLILAIFPALVAIVSLWGLIADPNTVSQQIEQMRTVTPQSVVTILQAQATRLASENDNTLGWSLGASVLMSLWSANRGTKAMVDGLNIVYKVPEKRGVLRLNLFCLKMTALCLVAGVVILALVAFLPPLLDFLLSNKILATILFIAEWPALIVLVMLIFSLLYKKGPCRPDPGWRWVWRGALTGTVVWLIISLLFAIYARNFADFNAVYGSLGGVIIFLIWLFLSAQAVLAGAEVNDAIETQMSTTVVRPTSSH